MTKSILNLGKALNKTEQKTINGGVFGGCTTDSDCRRSPLYQGGPVACTAGRCSFLLNL